MSNKIEIFKNSSFGSVRAFADDKGEPWFCGNDVATALGYANPRDALEKRCKTPGVVKRDVGVVTGKKADGSDAIQIVSMTYINEANMYRLIFGSKLETAEQFQCWVVEDVLPTIRKHGMYATPATIEEMLNDPDTMIATLVKLKEERAARIKAEEENRLLTVERDTYSDMVDDVMQDDTTYTATEIAKDIGLPSAISLNKWLVDVGFMYKSGNSYLPYAKYSKQGYTSHKLFDTGHGFNVKTVKFTNKGKIWIAEMWKNKNKKK